MNLAHVRRGKGPLVIVIQQLDPPAFWAKTIDDLSEACEVIAVDLPGFGESPGLSDEQSPSVAALTDAVATWIAASRLDRAYVVGNSLGGAVAIELAKRNVVAGAIAVSPLGFWTQREAARALRSLRVGGAVARAVVSRPGVVTRTKLGRTLAFGQLVARPWSMAESTARSALVGMATRRDRTAMGLRRETLLPFPVVRRPFRPSHSHWWFLRPPRAAAQTLGSRDQTTQRSPHLEGTFRRPVWIPCAAATSVDAREECRRGGAVHLGVPPGPRCELAVAPDFVPLRRTGRPTPNVSQRARPERVRHP